MKVETITIKGKEYTKLTAENNTYLTNGETYTDINGSVFLGKYDKPENWCEITERPEPTEET